jgi:hypothetical protein
MVPLAADRSLASQIVGGLQRYLNCPIRTFLQASIISWCWTSHQLQVTARECWCRGLQKRVEFCSNAVLKMKITLRYMLLHNHCGLLHTTESIYMKISGKLANELHIQSLPWSLLVCVVCSLYKLYTELPLLGLRWVCANLKELGLGCLYLKSR